MYVHNWRRGEGTRARRCQIPRHHMYEYNSTPQPACDVITIFKELSLLLLICLFLFYILRPSDDCSAVDTRIPNLLRVRPIERLIINREAASSVRQAYSRDSSSPTSLTVQGDTCCVLAIPIITSTRCEFDRSNGQVVITHVSSNAPVHGASTQANIYVIMSEPTCNYVYMLVPATVVARHRPQSRRSVLCMHVFSSVTL